MTDDTLAKLARDMREFDEPEAKEWADRLDALAAQQVPEEPTAWFREVLVEPFMPGTMLSVTFDKASVTDEHEPLYTRPQQVPESGEFEVWQDDMMVAGSSGPWHDALRDAQHYASQYAQDGPVELFEVRRTLVAKVELCGEIAKGVK